MSHGFVHVIDDDMAILNAVDLLLRTNGFEVQTYCSAQEFFDFDGRADGPECIVTDVRMPGMDGVELIGEMKRRGLRQPVILLTAYADVPLAVLAMKQGAENLLEKPFRAQALIAAVQQAVTRAQGGAREKAVVQEASARLACLSARERDVLSGLVRGSPNKVIAHEMGISVRTVEVHRANIMKKTGAKSLSELVRMSLLAEREAVV